MYGIKFGGVQFSQIGDPYHYLIFTDAHDHAHHAPYSRVYSVGLISRLVD